jgi:hypothetical protein
MRTQTRFYRGYELSAARDSSNWNVQIWPGEPDLPSLDPLDQLASHRELEIAFLQASRRIDALLGVKRFTRHVLTLHKMQAQPAPIEPAKQL